MDDRVLSPGGATEYVAPTPDRRRWSLALDPVIQGDTGNLVGSRSLSAGFVVLPPLQSQPGASNHQDVEEVFLVLRGRGEIELDGRAFAIEPGTVFHVPFGCDHRLVNRSEEELEVFYANTPPLSESELKPIVGEWARSEPKD